MVEIEEIIWRIDKQWDRFVQEVLLDVKPSAFTTAMLKKTFYSGAAAVIASTPSIGSKKRILEHLGAIITQPFPTSTKETTRGNTQKSDC